MPRRFTVLCAIIGLIHLTFGGAFASTAAAHDATPAAHPFAGDPAWIAYQSGLSGEDGVWLIHPDGTDEHQIATDLPGGELLPDWSPDGTRIVFTTRGGETEPLYEYDLATQTSRQLFDCIDPCLGDDEPVYSPDGTQVAFVRALGPFLDTGPSDCGLWLGDLATGEVTQLTSNADPACDREYNPHWSPDGTQLTYWRYQYANGLPTGTSVFVIDADGTNEQQLTDWALFAGSPDWSPDGKWIVFSTYPLLEYQCCEVSNLYRMHPDGTGMEPLTDYPTEELRATQPRYTPDGQGIVFTAVTPASRSFWFIPADGGEAIVIVNGGIYTHAAWQPTPGLDVAAQAGTPPASPVAEPSGASGTFSSLVDIGGRSLYLFCQGTGSPTVILEAGGFGTPSVVWAPVMAQVAEVTRVCRYERANNQSGESDPAPLPRTAADVVADLHALLGAAGVPGPYVMVGASVGGLFVRLYAHTYPDEVVGMVLVDASHEEAPSALGLFLTAEELALSQGLDFEGGDPEGILTAESYPQTIAQIREARRNAPMRPMPLVVLIAGATEDLTDDGYSAHEQAVWWPLTRVLGADLAALVPDGRLVVVEGSGHAIHEEQPSVVVQAIANVVDAVRDPTTWTSSTTPVP